MVDLHVIKDPELVNHSEHTGSRMLLRDPVHNVHYLNVLLRLAFGLVITCRAWDVLLDAEAMI